MKRKFFALILSVLMACCLGAGIGFAFAAADDTAAEIKVSIADTIVYQDTGTLRLKLECGEMIPHTTDIRNTPEQSKDMLFLHSGSFLTLSEYEKAIGFLVNPYINWQDDHAMTDVNNQQIWINAVGAKFGEGTTVKLNAGFWLGTDEELGRRYVLDKEYSYTLQGGVWVKEELPEEAFENVEVGFTAVESTSKDTMLKIFIDSYVPKRIVDVNTDENAAEMIVFGVGGTEYTLKEFMTEYGYLFHIHINMTDDHQSVVMDIYVRDSQNVDKALEDGTVVTIKKGFWLSNDESTMKRYVNREDYSVRWSATEGKWVSPEAEPAEEIEVSIDETILSGSTNATLRLKLNCSEMIPHTTDIRNTPEQSKDMLFSHNGGFLTLSEYEKATGMVINPYINWQDDHAMTDVNNQQIWINALPNFDPPVFAEGTVIKLNAGFWLGTNEETGHKYVLDKEYSYELKSGVWVKEGAADFQNVQVGFAAVDAGSTDCMLKIRLDGYVPERFPDALSDESAEEYISFNYQGNEYTLNEFMEVAGYYFFLHVNAGNAPVNPVMDFYIREKDNVNADKPILDGVILTIKAGFWFGSDTDEMLRYTNREDFSVKWVASEKAWTDPDYVPLPAPEPTPEEEWGTVELTGISLPVKEGSGNVSFKLIFDKPIGTPMEHMLASYEWLMVQRAAGNLTMPIAPRQYQLLQVNGIFESIKTHVIFNGKTIGEWFANDYPTNAETAVMTLIGRGGDLYGIEFVFAGMAPNPANPSELIPSKNAITTFDQDFTFEIKAGLRLPMLVKTTRDYKFIYTKDNMQFIEEPTQTNDDASITGVYYNGNKIEQNGTLNLSVDKLDLRFLTVFLGDENATYTVTGYENLKEGTNEITIKVTATDGTSANEFKFNVNYADNSAGCGSSLSYGTWLIAGIVLVCTAFLSLTKGRSKGGNER